jgi:hypothetical protein
MTSNLIETIEELAEAVALDIPYENKGKIHIKRTLIQPSKRGYVVFDTAEKKKLAETFSKAGAIAAAKANNANNFDAVKEIIMLDKTLQKYYNDALFYRHTIRKTKDKFKKEYTIIRFEIACDKVNSLRNAIEKFVYDK